MSINQASINLTSGISAASSSLSVDDKSQFSNDDSFKALYNSLNNRAKSTLRSDLPDTNEKRTSAQLDRVDKRDLDRQRSESTRTERSAQSGPKSDNLSNSEKSQELNQASSRAEAEEKKTSASRKEVAAESGKKLPSSSEDDVTNRTAVNTGADNVNPVDSAESISQTHVPSNSSSLTEAQLKNKGNVTESDLQQLTGLLGDIESLSNSFQQNVTTNNTVVEQLKSVLDLSSTRISALKDAVDVKLAQYQINADSERAPLLLGNLRSVLASLDKLSKVLNSQQLGAPTVGSQLHDVALINNSINSAGLIKLGDVGLTEQVNSLATELANLKAGISELRQSLNTQPALFNEGLTGAQNKSSEAFLLGINNPLQGSQSTAAIATPIGLGTPLDSALGASKDLLTSKDSNAIQQLTLSSGIQRSSALGSSTESNLAAAQTNVLRLTSNNFLGQSGMPEELQANLKMMLSRGIPSAELQLKPASLGALSIRIESSDEGSLVQFSVQSSVAKEQIEMHLPRLRELFTANQLALGDVSVSTDDQKESDQQKQDANAELNTTVSEQNLVNLQSSETVQSVTITSNNTVLDVYA